MRIVEEASVPATPEAIWALLRDVSVVASCVPGLTLSPRPDGAFEASMTVRLGVVRARFDGLAEISFDDGARRVSVRSSGADRSGSTRVAATMDVELDAGQDESIVRLIASVDLSGPLKGPAELGGPAVMRRLLREFGLCVQTKARKSVLDA